MVGPTRIMIYGIIWEINNKLHAILNNHTHTQMASSKSLHLSYHNTEIITYAFTSIPSLCMWLPVYVSVCLSEGVSGVWVWSNIEASMLYNILGYLPPASFTAHWAEQTKKPHPKQAGRFNAPFPKHWSWMFWKRCIEYREKKTSRLSTKSHQDDLSTMRRYFTPIKSLFHPR